MAPLANLLQVIQERRRRFGHLVEAVQAQVVSAAFQQGGAHGATDRLADQRQVAVVQLIL